MKWCGPLPVEYILAPPKASGQYPVAQSWITAGLVAPELHGYTVSSNTGSMPRPSNQVSISLRLEQSLLDRIDAAAAKRTIDRSAFIRMGAIAMLEGTTPAAQGGAAPSADIEKALGLLLDRVEALEKTCRAFAAFMDDGNERLAALEGAQPAVEAPASGLLERLMNARPAEG